MSRQYLELGPVPCDEDAAQVGDPDYQERSWDECQRYIRRLMATVGEPPQGASFGIHAFPHDFGTYYEVVCYYERDNEAATDYAYRCESDGPTT